MGNSATGSVARRLALRSIVLLAVVFFTMSLFIGWLVERNAREDIERLVADKAQSMATVVQSADSMSSQMLLQAFQSLKKNFDAPVELDVAAGHLLSWGTPLNDNFAIVDRFTADVGRVATVFMRRGDDFVRISTSVKQQDGQRAVGTLLDRQNPAYAAILEGKSYTGRAVLFGTPYMTHYEPLHDIDGKVVGILFAGSDITLFDQTTEQQINAVRFFDTGGMYVIDPRKTPAEAVFAVHPRYKGKKVLEAFPQALPFLEKLANSHEGLFDDAPAILGQNGHDKWATMRISPLSHWWVVAEVDDAEAMQRHHNVMYVIWATLAAAAVLLGAGLFVMIRRTVSHPLAELTDVITALAKGDLTQASNSQRQDEIGVLMRAIEAMRVQYQQILSQVREASRNVGVASAEISSGSLDLSARTEQTASSLEQTAASMEELTGIVRQSAESSSKANELAASACTVAQSGGVVVNDVVMTMDDINHSSRKIADIITVIDGIAFQTNLLALNASVEAARAGEQGRGFAVVASEVRNLAQRSASAALEIKELINDSVDKVGHGAVLVKKAGDTMQDIVTSVQQVSTMLAEITTATAEQALGIGQVNSAVNQLDQMTQQNAALVEESAAAAGSLKEQAEQLNEAIAVFNLGVNASVASPATQPVFTRRHIGGAPTHVVQRDMEKDSSVY